ncbi:MAG: hypothetical protein IKZ62_02275 [Prevotella sp.]|nr:hypothetical protein [Prevotella sp.]
MRKILMTAAALMLTLTITVFTSCTSDNDDNPVPPPAPEQLAEYTIMYYGNGGADADQFLLPMISNLYKASPEAYEKVNVVAQYKFSTAENLKNQNIIFDTNTCETFGSKNVRWVVDPTKTFQEQVFSRNSIYGADNADFTCPDSLTNFIDWAAKVYPAKKYMLIVNDHGHGYQPNEELPETTPASNRGMLFDDGHLILDQKKHFTVKSFHRAVEAASVRFETIYIWACLMNNLEYQFELQDLCDYIIASTYNMPAYGGAFNELPEMLSQPNVDIERVLDAYCKTDVASWDKTYADGGASDDTPIYTDMTVTRTASIAHLGKMMREFTDRLCNTYQNGTEAQRQAIDYCTASAVKVKIELPYYDMAKYMASLMTALPEVYDDEFYSQMEEAFNSCIVAQYFSKYLTTHNYMVDYSALIGAEGAYSNIAWLKDPQTGNQVPVAEIRYCADGRKEIYKIVTTDDPYYYEMTFVQENTPWGATLADTYEQLVFDRTVGWSRWLRLNRQEPNIFCPSDMRFELPMP